MLSSRFLNLVCVHLGGAQSWTTKGEHLAFLFPKAGIGNYIVGSKVQRLAAGDVLVLRATFGGSVCAANGGALDFWWFSVHLEHLFPLFASGEISRLQHIVDGFKTAKLFPAAGATARECHQRLANLPAPISLGRRSALLHVAAAVLADEFSHAEAAGPGWVRPEEHLFQVFTKLTPVELLSFSVNELAAQFGCSRRHLNRLFHHFFGVSVAALRMEMRLLRSITLLRNPELKIIRVAEDCGFNWLGLFNLRFRRRFGVSPREWRKLDQQFEQRRAPSKPAVITCPLRVNGMCPASGPEMNSARTAIGEAGRPAKAKPARLLVSARVKRDGAVKREMDAGQELLGTPAHRLIVRLLVIMCLMLKIQGWCEPPSSSIGNVPPLVLAKAQQTSATTQSHASTNNSQPDISRGEVAPAPQTELRTATNGDSVGAPNAMEALDDKHTLAIGDVLSFRILEDDEAPQSLVVTDSGELEIPYLGRFPAENLTCKQLARKLKTALEKDFYYQATVIIAVNTMTKSRGKVYLVGPVRMPGPQELPSDEVLTVSKAILRAGGFSDFADQRHVKITRDGSGGQGEKETWVVDVGQIYDHGKTETDMVLNAGDLIYIPRRLVNF